MTGSSTRRAPRAFEQMGIDDMTIDEAHEFKNLYYHTRTTGVRGMGDQGGSKKAFDLYNKVRVLRDSPTGSVVFMTGTPISNSAVEMSTYIRQVVCTSWRFLFDRRGSRPQFARHKAIEKLAGPTDLQWVREHPNYVPDRPKRMGQTIYRRFKKRLVTTSRKQPKQGQRATCGPASERLGRHPALLS